MSRAWPVNENGRRAAVAERLARGSCRGSGESAGAPSRDARDRRHERLQVPGAPAVQRRCQRRGVGQVLRLGLDRVDDGMAQPALALLDGLEHVQPYGDARLLDAMELARDERLRHAREPHQHVADRPRPLFREHLLHDLRFSRGMVRWLDPVAAALDGAPAEVPVFFRDDDAGWADDRLLALLDRFSELGLPLDVAAIPAALGTGISRELLARGVAVHQHGLAHANHEPEGRKHEFGPSRSREAQRRDIAAGRELLAERLDGAVEPMFTPPWNRCTRETALCLVELGFAVLSRESRAEPFGVPGLRELPVSLDFARLSPEEFGARFAAARPPVGVMFHHAEMGAVELARAGELLELLAGHPRVVARPMMALARGSREP
jgi:hypothetical protein